MFNQTAVWTYPSMGLLSNASNARRWLNGHSFNTIKVLLVTAAVLATSILVGSRLRSTTDSSALTALQMAAPEELAASEGLSTSSLPLSLTNGVDIGSGVRLSVVDATEGSVWLADGIRQYGSRLSNTDLLLQALPHGGGRLLAVLNNQSAPTTLKFELSGLSGIQLKPTADGGINILSANNKFLTALDKPWARDADGQPVPTRYEVQDNHLTQVVEHQGHTYPVVMDPSWWRLAKCTAAIVALMSTGAVAAATIHAWGGPAMAAQLLVAAGGTTEWAKTLGTTAASVLGVAAIQDNCL